MKGRKVGRSGGNINGRENDGIESCKRKGEGEKILI